MKKLWKMLALLIAPFISVCSCVMYYLAGTLVDFEATGQVIDSVTGNSIEGIRVRLLEETVSNAVTNYNFIGEDLTTNLTVTAWGAGFSQTNIYSNYYSIFVTNTWDLYSFTYTIVAEDVDGETNGSYMPYTNQVTLRGWVDSFDLPMETNTNS